MKGFKSMQGRGRNGRFDIEETNIAQTAGGHTTWVEVFSRRKGITPPIVIVGNTGDVLAWAKGLVEGIEHGIRTLGCKAIQDQLDIHPEDKDGGEDTSKDGRKVLLTEDDWAEIYYALLGKACSPTISGSDRESVRWRKHLEMIIEMIGPDGLEAAEHGTGKTWEPNKRPTK